KSLPRRAVTGGVDGINAPSWEFLAQLWAKYNDVIVVDPAISAPLAGLMEKEDRQTNPVQDCQGSNRVSSPRRAQRRRVHHSSRTVAYPKRNARRNVPSVE